jgi:hypothetical protein
MFCNVDYQHRGPSQLVKLSSRRPREEEVANFLLSLKHRSVTPEPDSASTFAKTIACQDIDVNKWAEQSLLVAADDRDLVPDSLFVAMAQMKPTKMELDDRLGCYKTRPLGFQGFCCMHCGGLPGFGRYFPNSVRSLSQTTTSQTILKHISTKVREQCSLFNDFTLIRYPAGLLHVCITRIYELISHLAGCFDSFSVVHVHPKYAK